MIKRSTISDIICDAVNRENIEREARAKSVIITGLPERDDDDSPQVLDLLYTEFSFNPEGIRCKRIGTRVEGRPRLLRVSFLGSEEAAWLVGEAPKLRKSRDSAVRTIYINKNLSAHERSAAYEVRKRRRERLAADMIGTVDQKSVDPGSRDGVIVNSNRRTASEATTVADDISYFNDLDAFPVLGASNNISASGVTVGADGVPGTGVLALAGAGAGSGADTGVHPNSVDSPATSQLRAVSGAGAGTGVHPNIVCAPAPVVVSQLSAEAQSFEFVPAGLADRGDAEGRPTTGS